MLSSRRRRQRRRRLTAAVALLAAATAIVVAYGIGRPAAPRRPSGRTAASHPGRNQIGHTASTTSSSTTTTSTVPPTTTTTTGPGTLPQTPTLPSATSPQFHVEMADLWQGVISGTVSPAMPAFFPVGAYVQLKSITNAQGDWQNRLVGDFTLDIGAVHALLGAGATSAQLVSVNVPTQYAHWVTPGVCYNSIGYYEVPNARVIYREGGVVRSFGIASMISWRGQWYVVHLGAVLRTTTARGVVDEPATGPGTSAYSSTC